MKRLIVTILLHINLPQIDISTNPNDETYTKESS